MNSRAESRNKKIADIDSEGVHKTDKSGDLKYITDGYTRTSPGAMGVLTMNVKAKNQDKSPNRKLNGCEITQDEIVSVRMIPEVRDNLFVLTKKGMMIRVSADQTKETSGKATRGTRIMELRTFLTPFSKILI